MTAPVFTIRPWRSALRRPWVAASATIAERGGFLVAATADGVTGWGDCAPLPSTGEAGLRRVGAALDAVLAGRASSGEPEVAWAVATATADLAARRAGVPLRQILASRTPSSIAVNAALGPLDAACGERAVAAVAAGFEIGKIKVGLDDPQRELAVLDRVVARTEGKLRLRLDANRAWSVTVASRILTALAALPIDGVEEPLDRPDLDTLAQLQADLPFALAVDESLGALGAAALFDRRSVRRLVIKPARIGSPETVRRLAETAIAAGVEVVLTSVVDSAIGVRAAAHLAAAWAPTAVHGLATSSWLMRDVAPPPSIVAGRLALDDGIGVGAVPYEAA